MKTRIIFYEILAASLATLAAIFLVISFFPILNPSNYEVAHSKNELGAFRYVIGIIGFLGLFWFSNRFNKKALMFRKDKSRKVE